MGALAFDADRKRTSSRPPGLSFLFSALGASFASDCAARTTRRRDGESAAKNLLRLTAPSCPFPRSFAMSRHGSELSLSPLESSLPKPWEREETFQDALYEWMERAPWLALSAGAHVIVVLICLAIPWDKFERAKAVELKTKLDTPPVDEFVDPPPEEPVEIEEELPVEPQLQEAEISEHDKDDSDQPFESTAGDPDFNAEATFDQMSFNPELGIGGGAGGNFGDHLGGNRKSRAPRGAGVEQAVTDGLEWLRWHQSASGAWEAEGFTSNCGRIGATVCTDVGEQSNDVGMTGLALLAFLGDGNTTREGPYKENVARGIKWLKEHQEDTGLFGGRIGHAFMYNHAIASLAMCEAYYFSQSPLIKGSAQRSVEVIMQARNPYGAWRYSDRPDGDNDTSVTGWMVFALKSAEEAKLKVDKESFVGALNWIEEMTDPSTARVGYDSAGSASSRVARVNENFNQHRGEAMTAVGLLCRVFLGQDPRSTPILARHADLLASKLPVWSADPSKEAGTDFYYWYYGSYAMYQMGGGHWAKWVKAMEAAVVKSQRKDGDEKGSWDAKVDPWGHAGGRVYSTALGVLCLEVYYRYARVLGAR
jgi:hypothetical protein